MLLPYYNVVMLNAKNAIFCGATRQGHDLSRVSRCLAPRSRLELLLGTFHIAYVPESDIHMYIHLSK